MSLLSKTPGGGDYTSCPLCGFCTYDDKCIYIGSCEFEDLNICGECNFVFSLGHSKMCEGCTEDVRFVWYVSRFEHSNGNLYIGKDAYLGIKLGEPFHHPDYPVEKDDIDNAVITRRIINGKIIELSCSCDGVNPLIYSIGAHYPATTHPQCYEFSCEVVKQITNQN